MGNRSFSAKISVVATSAVIAVLLVWNQLHPALQSGVYPDFPGYLNIPVHKIAWNRLAVGHPFRVWIKGLYSPQNLHGEWILDQRVPVPLEIKRIGKTSDGYFLRFRGVDSPAGGVLRISQNGSTLVEKKIEFFQPELPREELRDDSAPSRQLASAVPDSPFVTRSHTQVCEYCNFEFALFGRSERPHELVLAASNAFYLSQNGGRNWQMEFVDNADVFTPDDAGYSSLFYRGDPEFVALQSGFGLVGLFDQNDPQVTLGTLMYKGSAFSSPRSLEVEIVQGRTTNAEANQWGVSDYPKVARDSKRGRIYISSNGSYFEDRQERWSGLYVSGDDGETFQLHWVPSGFPLKSLAVREDGELLATNIFPMSDGSPAYGIELYRYPLGQYDDPEVSTIPFGKIYTIANTKGRSDGSGISYLTYPGPEILIDQESTSPFAGRIYLAWAEPEEYLPTLSQPDFKFGRGYMIKVARSLDGGRTWQVTPVAPEMLSGDQTFPSLSIDSTGRLHVAFVLSYEAGSQHVHDTYYTLSRDGGVTFLPPHKVNFSPAPSPAMNGATRPLGDYLDMVVGAPDRAYIAHNCGTIIPPKVCLTEVENASPVIAPPNPPPPANGGEIDPFQIGEKLESEPKSASSFGSCSPKR